MPKSEIPTAGLTSPFGLGNVGKPKTKLKYNEIH
jgi:hypothetical protein